MGKQFSITVKWNDLSTKGKFDGRVVILTNDKLKPRFDIPVHVTIK